MGKQLNYNLARMYSVAPVMGKLCPHSSSFIFDHLVKCMVNVFFFFNSFGVYLSRQGGKTGAVQKCTTCRGRGMRIMIRQLAPGMVQQMQSVCTDCNGEGKANTDPRPYSAISSVYH